LAPAESAGLLEVGARLRFRHPLVHSAVYRAAPSDERREVHRVLAEATDAEVDPDRRAWHRAESTAGPDEDVAAVLERPGDRSHARGGAAAAAAFLERASALTLAPARRAHRALAAAQSKFEAGSMDEALMLFARASSTGPASDLSARGSICSALRSRPVSARQRRAAASAEGCP
jgi:hypothetical protein